MKGVQEVTTTNSEGWSMLTELVLVNQTPTVGAWLLYGMLVILSIIVFNLGFARKLSLLKNVFVYFMLLVLALPLTLLAIFGLPVAESLVIIAIVFGAYKWRLAMHRKSQANT